MVSEAVPQALKRRARNKSDKLRRIKAAARELFLKKGFDDTTMREIARRAEVGLGTLFSYAADKRDLLFLIYNDEQDYLNRESSDRIKKSRSFFAKLIAVFSVYYRFGAEQPTFMRYVLRELTFYTSGHQATRFRKGRDAIISRVEAVVADGKKRGELRSREKNETIARVLFAIYQAEIRRWLMHDSPRAASGLHSLRRALRIPMEGLRNER